MPFSDEEQIVVEEKSKIKTIILLVSISLFISSLFTNAFCSGGDWVNSGYLVLLGWLGLIADSSAISWLANPFLLASWILLFMNKKNAWIFGLLATVFSISFLCFKTVLRNEAGHYERITAYGNGYWLWLFSCSVSFLGGVIIKSIKK